VNAREIFERWASESLLVSLECERLDTPNTTLRKLAALEQVRNQRLKDIGISVPSPVSA